MKELSLQPMQSRKGHGAFKFCNSCKQSKAWFSGSICDDCRAAKGIDYNENDYIANKESYMILSRRDKINKQHRR